VDGQENRVGWSHGLFKTPWVHEKIASRWYFQARTGGRGHAQQPSA
jgi:hypothetical protein